MDERVIQFRVGVVVLCAGLITGILVFIFGEGWTPRYTIYIPYSSAPGISKNVPVRKNGILIGRVTDVDLREDGVLLTAKIDTDIKLYSSEVCQLGTMSLLGDPVLEFVPGPNSERGVLIEDGYTVQNTSIKEDPLKQMGEAVEKLNLEVLQENVIDMKVKLDETFTRLNEETIPTFESAGNSVRQAGDEIALLTNTIRTALGDDMGGVNGFFDDVRDLTSTTKLAVEEFHEVMANVNNILGDEKLQTDLRESLAGLPSVIRNAETTMLEAQETIESFQMASESARVNLQNLEGLTGSLNDNGEQMVEDLQMSLRSVSEMAVQLEKFTRSLNEGDGTIDRLLNDPQLYNEFLLTIQNIQEITRTARPLVQDLRIAADKIARDPGQLGLRGAFDRTPIGGGTKNKVLSSSPNDRWIYQ